MMPILLLWFLVAPSLPGADTDTALIACPLRERVVRSLGVIVFAGVLFWLACSAAGVLVAGGAAAAGIPGASPLGLAIALSGAAGAAVWTLAACFLEQAWLNALGMPRDWRGPWLAGDLASHMGVRRRRIRVDIPRGTRPPNRPTPGPATAAMVIPSTHRSAEDDTRATEMIKRPSTPSMCWLAEPTDSVP